jgi:hypothetical protein
MDTVHSVDGGKGVHNLVMMAIGQEEREFGFFLDNGMRERAEVPIIRVGEGRILTVEESYEIERAHAAELIEKYVRSGRSTFRDDLLYEAFFKSL